MSLTAAQLEQRTHGVGASEVAALAGLNRFSDPIKVWATKARGPEGEIPPMIPPDDPELVSKRGLGHVLEPVICNLYQHEEGNGDLVILPCHTLVHPESAHILATPDRLVFPSLAAANDPHTSLDGCALHGLETKLVGRYMADDWSDGVPDYVVCQCQQNMGVTGLGRWDVAALIGGTEFQVFTVWRDDDVITALNDIIHAFWEDFVVADVMPDVVDGKMALKVLQTKWSKDNGQKVDAPPEAAPLAERLAMIMAWTREAKKQGDAIKAELCKLTGENKGLKGDWGSFSWPTMQGGVQWKEAALSMADGLAEHLDVEPEVILDIAALCHRSGAYRKAALYPKKVK